MASLINGKNGNRRIQYTDADGNRRTIYPGKISKRQAEVVKLRVEDLLTAKLSGDLPKAETSLWLKTIDEKLRSKLIHHELIEPLKATGAIALGEHLENYFAARSDVKQSTLLNWGHTKRCLLEYFGEDRSLDSITKGDAGDFERWLRTGAARNNRYAETEAEQGLAPNTVRKRISNAKQFFEDAVQRELIERNPFAGLKGAVGSNRKRDYFVTRDEADKVLQACPDTQWRLLFALSRYGGLRCPSETLSLQWGDINWAENRMVVRSPKTEHHENKATRVVPIFPELRTHLEQAWDEAEEGERYVITRYRDRNTNLRTQLLRIIERAGLEAWPKLFANLRASRATELAVEHPAHVAAAWLGHSVTVANKHYLQVTEADFEQATGSENPKAARKAARHSLAGSRLSSNEESGESLEPLKKQGDASERDSLQLVSVGDEGLEPPTSSV